MSCLGVQTRISIGVLAFLVISPATAADFAETARKAQAAYAAAQREWQIGLAALAVEQRPEFEAIAKAQRDLQVAYIERRTSRFEYLMAEDPSRIVLTEGLSPFINFDWTDEDTRHPREKMADPGDGTGRFEGIHWRSAAEALHEEVPEQHDDRRTGLGRAVLDSRSYGVSQYIAP